MVSFFGSTVVDCTVGGRVARSLRLNICVIDKLT